MTNVSITPYTYTEEFIGGDSVLSRDNLKIGFRVHLVWKVRRDRVKDFVEKYSTLYDNKKPDKIVQDAYNNFLREPLRTYARDEIQRLNGLEIKDKITPIGDAVFGLMVNSGGYFVGRSKKSSSFRFRFSTKPRCTRMAVFTCEKTHSKQFVVFGMFKSGCFS